MLSRAKPSNVAADAVAQADHTLSLLAYPRLAMKLNITREEFEALPLRHRIVQNHDSREHAHKGDSASQAPCAVGFPALPGNKCSSWSLCGGRAATDAKRFGGL